MFRALVSDILRDILNKYALVYFDPHLFPFLLNPHPSRPDRPPAPPGELFVCQGREKWISCGLCHVHDWPGKYTDELREGVCSHHLAQPEEPKTAPEVPELKPYPRFPSSGPLQHRFTSAPIFQVLDPDRQFLVEVKHQKWGLRCCWPRTPPLHLLFLLSPSCREKLWHWQPQTLDSEGGLGGTAPLAQRGPSYLFWYEQIIRIWSIFAQSSN